MQHPIQILERYWKFTSFKPLQEDIINAVLENEDTFALLPTGGGKSMCFQIPALAKEGICIVVSPLIALMKNQVSTLKEKGIKAMALTNEFKYNDIDTMLDNCIYGNYKFLYLSPERLQQELVQDRIQQMNVNLIAVDEAHCISQWGNDFRPAYKNIVLLRKLLPNVNVIALTASATPQVAKDIVEELDFINPKIFKQSFKREHLAYMVFDEDLQKVAGIVFYEHQETPGLGGEIEKPYFCNQFSDPENEKILFQKDGAAKQLRILKPGSKLDDSSVNGITAATMTCDRLQEFINSDLVVYGKYFKTIREL